MCVPVLSVAAWWWGNYCCCCLLEHGRKPPSRLQATWTVQAPTTTLHTASLPFHCFAMFYTYVAPSLVDGLLSPLYMSHFYDCHLEGFALPKPQKMYLHHLNNTFKHYGTIVTSVLYLQLATSRY